MVKGHPKDSTNWGEREPHFFFYLLCKLGDSIQQPFGYWPNALTTRLPAAPKYTYIRRYTHTYIYTYMHAYIHTYIHTYIHACMHTYIHAYMHTYIHILERVEKGETDRQKERGKRLEETERGGRLDKCGCSCLISDTVLHSLHSV